jgi:hypothetical protein
VGDARERGEFVQEVIVPLEHASDLRLLEHQFRNEDAIRVSRAPPRKVASIGAEPPAQLAAEAAADIVRDAHGSRERSRHGGANDIGGRGGPPAKRRDSH